MGKDREFGKFFVEKSEVAKLFLKVLLEKLRSSKVQYEIETYVVQKFSLKLGGFFQIESSD